MTMTFKEACEAVADLFEAVPETFCKYAYERTANGEIPSWYQDDDVADSPSAVRFCVVGGVSAATGQTIGEVRKQLSPYLTRYKTPEDVNNCGGREAVIDLLREAAKCST